MTFANPQRGLSFAVWGTIGFLWALALWHSWECRGLFWDGAAFLLDLLIVKTFVVYDPSRRYAVFLTEIPAVAAIWLGERNLHWMARWHSLGMFGVPTALYSLAVLRARHDAVLLAVTIATIAMVFMPTSFFIVGEYNVAHAAALLAAVCLIMDRLRISDGIVVLCVAALALRTYETFVFLGPLLGLMTVWTICRAPTRPVFATSLHGAAALLFLGAAAIEIQSLFSEDTSRLVFMASSVWRSRTNGQFDLALAAAAVLLGWALLRPDDLRRRTPYLWAGVPLVVTGLLPLLAVLGVLENPPYAVSQHTARIAAGGVVAIVIVVMWIYRSALGERLAAFAVLKAPDTARRLVGFAALMLLAQLPWDLFLTRVYSLYLEEVRTATRAQSGAIVAEQPVFVEHPRLSQDEEWTLPCLSLVLRSKPGDGILYPPNDSATGSMLCFDPAKLSELAPYSWRD